MSLLSPDRLKLFISPAGLFGVLRRGFTRSSKDEGLCWSQPMASAAAWKDALPALTVALKDMGRPRVQAVLSNHLVRYAVLHWNDDLAGREEDFAFARFVLSETYGAETENWRIAISDDPPGKSRLAAAVDDDLIADLNAAVQSAGSRMVSAAPCLSAAVNYWRREIRAKQSTWFVLHEQGRLCLALLALDEWRWVRTQRVSDHWADRLAEIIADELVLAGIEQSAGEILVFSPGVESSAELPMAGTACRFLPAAGGWDSQADAIRFTFAALA